MVSPEQGGRQNVGERPLDLSQLDSTLSPAEAHERIKQFGTLDDMRRQEMIDSGELDAAIASMMLSHITRRFPATTESQVASLAGNGWYRNFMRALGIGGKVGTVTTAGTLAGGAPTAVPALERFMQLATSAANVNIPKTEALVGTVFTLSLLAAAVASPLTYPWRFRPRNRDESLQAANVLRTILGEGVGEIRTEALKGNAEEVAKACAERIDALLGPVDDEGRAQPISATRKRTGASVGLLGMAALAAVTIAAGAKTWRDATQALEREAIRSPGLAMARAANPQKAAQDFLNEVAAGFSLKKGAADVGEVFGTGLANRAGVAMGAVEPPDNSPARKRKQK